MLRVRAMLGLARQAKPGDVLGNVSERLSELGSGLGLESLAGIRCAVVERGNRSRVVELETNRIDDDALRLHGRACVFGKVA